MGTLTYHLFVIIINKYFELLILTDDKLWHPHMQMLPNLSQLKPKPIIT